MFTEEQLLACVPKLQKFARSLRWRDGDAEDLVQDVLARAWSRRHLFADQGEGSLMAWCGNMMHNQNVTWVRAGIRRDKVLPPWAGGRHGNRPRFAEIYAAPDNTDARVIVGELVHALAALRREEQEVIQLIALNDMTYQQVADKLGMPVGTVRSRIARGRAALRLMGVSEHLAGH